MSTFAFADILLQSMTTSRTHTDAVWQRQHCGPYFSLPCCAVWNVNLWVHGSEGQASCAADQARHTRAS